MLELKLIPASKRATWWATGFDTNASATIYTKSSREGNLQKIARVQIFQFLQKRNLRLPSHHEALPSQISEI